MPRARERSLSLLALLALLGAGAWWLLSADRAQPVRDVTAIAPAAAGVAPSAAQAVLDGGESDQQQPGPDPDQATAPPRRAARGLVLRTPTRGVLRGRCIDADSGDPLAGVRVTLQGRALLSPVLAELAEPLDWRDPDPVVTSKDGAFAFVIHPNLPLEHRLLAECDEWLPCNPTGWVAAESIEGSRTLQFRRVAPAIVRVVDHERQPIAGVHLVVATGAAGLKPRTLRATSDARGFALFRPGLPRGLHRAFVSHGAASFGFGDFPVPHGDQVPEIRLERAPVVLAGRIVDARGDPVAGATIGADRVPADPGVRCATISADDGRFELASIDASASAWRIWSDVPLAEPPRDAREFATGTRSLRLVAAERGSIELTVVAAATQAPVERFAAGWSKLDGEGARADAEPTGLHPNGRVRLDGFPPGRWQLVVDPADPGLQIGESLPVQVDAGSVVQARVELAPASTVRLRVYGRGRPVAGAEVRLASIALPANWPRHRLQESPPPLPLGEPARDRNGCVGRGRTDRDGRVTIEVDQPADLHAHVLAAGFAPYLERIEPADDRELAIELQPGATLDVTLRPPGIAAELRALCGGAAPELILCSRVDARPDESLGSFLEDRLVVADLEAGFRQLQLLLPGVRRADRFSEPGRAQDPVLAQDVALAAGAAQAIHLDLSHCRPGTLELTLEPERGSLDDVLVLLQPIVDREARNGLVPPPQWVRAASDGRLPPIGLFPGRYEVHAPAAAFGGAEGATCTAERPIAIAPGARIVASLALRLRSAQVRFVTATGEPIRHAWLDLRLARSGSSDSDLRVATDGDGIVRIDAPGSWRVQLRRRRQSVPHRQAALPDGVDLLYGELTIPDRPGVHELTVQLRPR